MPIHKHSKCALGTIIEHMDWREHPHSQLSNALVSCFDMTEDEGRKLAAIPKWGEPRDQWEQERPNVLTNAFGVLNAEEQTIKGLQVDLDVFVSPRMRQIKYVFSLKSYELGLIERAYQLEINSRQGLRPTDHAYSHEHFGNKRFNADPSWANCDFIDAWHKFCKTINLKPTGKLPDYQGLVLK